MLRKFSQHFGEIFTNFKPRKSEKAFYSKEGIPECMPECYHNVSVVEAYKEYYKIEKLPFARYKVV